MNSDIEEEPDVQDQLTMAKMSSEQLQETWKHMIQNNLEEKWKTPIAQKKLLKDIWPNECMFVSLKSASTTTRRGKRKRAYPRKGVIKLPGDIKACKIKIGLHQLAAWKITKRVGNKDEQASHWKCDQEACVNPAHIIWETSDQNCTRYCCRVFKHIETYLCPHQPVCPGCKSCFD